MKDPRNHCVQLLEVLPDPLQADSALMVMPYLRPFDDPEFGAIGEVVEFVKQILEVSSLRIVMLSLYSRRCY